MSEENITKWDFNTSINDETGDLRIDVTRGTQLFTSWILETKEKAIRDALIELGWTPPNHIPEDGEKVQWEPNEKLKIIETERSEIWECSRSNDFEYLNFWWNVRQLLQELNGDWKRVEGKCESHWLLWDYQKEGWWVTDTAYFWEGVGPFKDENTASTAAEILNFSDWSKGGVPR